MTPPSFHQSGCFLGGVQMVTLRRKFDFRATKLNDKMLLLITGYKNIRDLINPNEVV